MTRYVVLFRGINVGRNNRIAMADLRELLTGLGYTDVRTLLQSGNAVLTARVRTPAALASAIEKELNANLGLTVRVLVRSRDDIAAAIEANPLPVPDGSKFMVSFLDGDPDPAVLRGIDAAAYEPEAFATGPGTLYVWCAHGVLESTLLVELADKKLGVVSTTRNWNTVGKLLALADAQ